MKRLFVILLALLMLLGCVPALAEGAAIKTDALPGDVREFFSASNFNGCVIGENAACVMENTVGGTYCFAVVQKDGRNVLYGFEKKNGRFQYWLRTDNCLPQGEGFFQVRSRVGYLYLFNGEKLDLSESLDILFTRADYEEQGDTELFFQVRQNGQFHLKLMNFDYLWSEALFTSESIAYYHEGDYLGTAYGTVETNLRYFSLSAFPRTLKDAREKLSAPPSIPAGELTATRVKFTGGQKYEVYSGPGAEYERAAGGKALVSTNDWIQVFGSENGYILIQYAISSSQMRFGYIPESALPAGQSASPLRLNFEDAAVTASTFLTDDPLNSQTRTRALSAGQEGVKWLADMGTWSYVEVTGAGQPIRGFMPAAYLRRGAGRSTYSAAFQNDVYAAQATAEVLNGGAVTVSITVSGPASWQSAPADGITGYQLYANNVPLSAYSFTQADPAAPWKRVFTLSAALPGGTAILGLCPVYAGGPRVQETMILYLSEK